MIRDARELFDTPPDLRAARRAARQHGLIRYRELVECGLDADAITRRVRKGWLHRVHHGVYAVGYTPQTLDAHFAAAVLAGGEAAWLSGWSSCSLAELVRWDGRMIEVTVRGSGGRSRNGIRFHRVRWLDPRDVTRIHGIPCTTPARAILEIAPQLSDRRLKRLVRKAQAEQLATTRQFADVLRRAPGYAGAGRIAAIIATGAAPTYSGDEDDVLDLILAAGFEHPDVNRRLVAGPATDRTPYVPDLRWPVQQLILEVDSAWHDDPLSRHLDAARQAELEAAGERVLRTTKEQALADPRQLFARLTAAGAPGQARSAPYTDAQP
jgi:predicted transcriptional regulator of viral defense system